MTAMCRKLRRLGLEIGARPFIYSDTPQLVLDSFLQYTDSTRYTVSTSGRGLGVGLQPVIISVL